MTSIKLQKAAAVEIVDAVVVVKRDKTRAG